MNKPTTKAFETFTVTVDYNKSLVDMIEAGHYDWKNNDITVEHFPVQGSGTEEDIKLHLVHLNRNATTEEITEHLNRLGLQPAKIEHLLAFGAKYPDIQREFPIVALSSFWVGSDGSRRVPFLSWDGSGRNLRLDWDHPDLTWDVVWRFLAVSK